METRNWRGLAARPGHRAVGRALSHALRRGLRQTRGKFRSPTRTYASGSARSYPLKRGAWHPMVPSGEATPHSVEAAVDRAAGYLPDEGAVRYVAGWEHRGHGAFVRGESTPCDPAYEMTPLDRWLRNESARVDLAYVDDLLADQLDGTTEVSASVTACVRQPGRPGVPHRVDGRPPRAGSSGRCQWGSKKLPKRPWRR